MRTAVATASMWLLFTVPAMHITARCSVLPLVAAVMLIAAPLAAQDSASVQDPHGVNLAIHGYGVSIGDSRGINGLRLNYRDSRLDRVNGVNITIWDPHDDPTGDVRGAAIGVPLTGARDITGLALGLGGVEAGDHMKGVGIGGLGLGAGGRMAGIMIGGLGIGSGDDLVGLGIGGLGLGAGDNVRGLMLGGLGVGAGNDLWGITIAGLGAGGGGNVKGITLAGIGVGAGNALSGLAIAGVGVGAADDLRGVAIGGVGVGAGGTLTGLGIAGVGVGAPVVKGVMLSGAAAGGQEVTGVVIAPAFFRIGDEGRFTGVSASAFNYVKGEQHGLTIGIFNYARRLFGVQLGLLNYAKNNPVPFRWLPLVNVHFE